MSTQEEVLDWLGRDTESSVFITGGAGRGKSHLLKTIAEDKGANLVIGAPTGIAALNVGGETMHSLLGLPNSLVTRADKDNIPSKARALFKKADFLAIDELAMVRSDYLDLIDYKLKTIRKNKKPFGGIQLICIGDFFQLEPILTREEKKHFLYDSAFCFSSDIWRETSFKVFDLLKCYRQEKEQQVRILDSIRRKDQHYRLAIKRINEFSKPLEPDDKTFTLTCYKADADYINCLQYADLEGEEFSYNATISGKFHERPVEENIFLKTGAKVLICANDIEGTYKNGEMGEVIELSQASVRVLKNNGDIVCVYPFLWEKYCYSSDGRNLTKELCASFSQIPLRLGYAIPIHKAQGITVEELKLDLGRGTFSHGQLYVAVSRITNLENLVLTRELRPSDLIVNDKVIEFYEEVKNVGIA